MSQPKVKRRRSTSKLLKTLAGIQLATEGIERALSLLAAAQGQPRCYVDDRCPADSQPKQLTPQQDGVPEEKERSAA